MSSKQLSELTAAAILADLRAGKSKRSISRDLAVSYYRVDQLAKELSGAELGGAVKLAPPVSPRLPESDLPEGGHPRTRAAHEGPEEEIVMIPVSQESTEAAAIPIDEAVQSVAYSVAGAPESPSEQAGTKRFDEAALAEIPEARELYEKDVSPVQHTEDGRPYLQKRVQWQPEVGANEPNITFDGKPLEEEAGLDKARSLRGWHEESRTYVVQIHPDDPRQSVHDLPDDKLASRSGKYLLPGSHSVAGGVVFTRRPTMTPEEWATEKWLRDMRRLSEHFG